MRNLDAGLAAALAQGATTLCHVWKVTRADGVALGFTDHDRDLIVDGVLYAARSGLDAAETQSALGLAATTADVAGALTSDAISEADLADGLYDGARVERWRVDWSDATRRVLLDVSDIGEVRRTQERFTAELRSLTHHLDQERGRLYQGLCSAEFCDARCGLSLAAHSVAATALAGCTESRLLVSPTALEPSALVGGVVAMASGASRRVRASLQNAAVLEIALWAPLSHVPTPGEQITLTAGCDKRFETCRDRFANAVNFRGFPHIPGADYALRFAQADGSADGALAR
jgi:uncharacterized phage protein (TIGR02218 family)